MRKYFDKYKRRFILSFLIPTRTLNKWVRELKRYNRLYQIRKRKEIYDLSTMD